MKFSFSDIYPNGEGLLTGERVIPEKEEREALGVNTDVGVVKKPARFPWVLLIVLVAVLVGLRNS